MSDLSSNLMLQMAFGKNGAQTLPAQLAGMLALLQSLNDNLAALVQQTGADTPQPDEAAKWITVNDGPGGAWATADQADIVGLLVTADTSDLYQLKVGNDNSFQFYVGAYQAFFLPLAGPLRIPITRGLPLSFAQVTAGTAKIKGIVWYLPQQDWGRKDKG